MSESVLSPEDQMMQWITSKWITKPIYVIAELGIADRLSDGPRAVEELAEETATHAPTLYRILRALSSVGVFAEIKDRVFGLTPLAETLSSNTLGPVAQMFLSPWHNRVWDGLSHTVRTGEPGFDHAFGRPAFEWLEAHPSERSVLDRGQGAKAAGFARAVTDAHDFSGIQSVCDIGGGQGVFLIHLLTRYPDLHGFVADLPGAVESAARAIAEAGIEDRCRAIPYDFNTGTPPECDGYFLINILHDWEDDVCVRILRNAAKAMAANSKLWIVEYVLEPGPGFSVAKLLDIEVLVMSGGRERTIIEYETLINSSGLEMAEIIPTKNGPAMLECRPGRQA